MKVLDESGNLFHFVGTATFIETVTDPRGVFDALSKTPDEVYALYQDITKVRGSNKTAFVAKKIRVTDEKSLDDMVRRFSHGIAGPTGATRVLTSFMRGKLLAE